MERYGRAFQKGARKAEGGSVIEFLHESASGNSCLMKFVDFRAFLKYVEEKGTVIVESPDAQGKPYHLKTVD